MNERQFDHKGGVYREWRPAYPPALFERLQSAAYLRDSADAYRRRGLADDVAAMEARLPLLLEQGKALELRRLHLTAEISLIQALGGGYTAPD